MACGAACMERADFGMSMVVAPAYLVHLEIAKFWPLFSFGLAEDVLQSVLLIVMCLIIRRFRAPYLFSFVTAVIYGVMLDGAVALVHLIPVTIGVRLLMYFGGMTLASAGVAFFCRTYIAPEVYELFVETVARKYGMTFHHMKMIYDIVSCVISLLLSFAFFGWGRFVGVGWGTVGCALVNGPLIGLFTKLYDRVWQYEDRFPKLRRIMPEHRM